MQSLEQQKKEIKLKFYNLVPGYIDNIEAAIENKDRDLVKRFSHDLSGASSTFAYYDLALVANLIHDEAFTSSLPNLKSYAESLKRLHFENKG